MQPPFPTPAASRPKRKRSDAGGKGKQRQTNDGEAANSEQEMTSDEEPLARRKKKKTSEAVQPRKRRLAASDWHMKRKEVPQGSERTKVSIDQSFLIITLNSGAYFFSKLLRLTYVHSGNFHSKLRFHTGSQPTI